MMGPYGSFGGMGGGGWLAMGFFLVVFWGVVVTGIVLLVRSHGHGDQVAQPAGPPAALRILDDRFARGEIDADEYGRRRQLLSAP